MGLYWNTLRLNRKNFTDQGAKRKNRWWHKGTELAVILTTKCNLHCDYCPMFLTDNKYPRFNDCTLEEWKDYFEKYPEWISQIFLTGGETSLVPYIAELTNWLVGRGHHVIIFSNLKKPEAFYAIKKSFRFVLIPTFHQHDDDKERFIEAYNKLKKNTKFRIRVQEMETAKLLDFSHHKDKFRNEWWYQENFLYHVSPDAPRTGRMFFGCNRAYLDGKN